MQGLLAGGILDPLIISTCAVVCVGRRAFYVRSQGTGDISPKVQPFEGSFYRDVCRM